MVACADGAGPSLDLDGVGGRYRSESGCCDLGARRKRTTRTTGADGAGRARRTTGCDLRREYVCCGGGQRTTMRDGAFSKMHCTKTKSTSTYLHQHLKNIGEQLRG